MSEPLLKRIQPSELPEVWDGVEYGLKQIIARCPTVPWTPRDVRRRLRAGGGALYLRDDGFVVMERLAEGISAEPFLNVWLMWFEPGAALAIRSELVEWLDESCRLTNCEWWEFTSSREMWGDVFGDMFEVSRVIVRRIP